MKEFTKLDLKNRMVVEYRNGERRMVVDNMIMGMTGQNCLASYNEDLILKGFKALDIMRVYGEIDSLSQLDNINCLILLWEREEVKEVTMAEVEEKFGCLVKIVKE